MKIEFREWGEWNPSVLSVVVTGTVNGERFDIMFWGKALAELFQVPNEPYYVENAVMRHQAFMNEIARDIIQKGLLEYDNTAMLDIEELLPYFEKRAAAITAPA